MERGYLLSEIAAAVGGTLDSDRGNDRVTELCIDTRALADASNALFVALKGPHHDGHDHIGEAAERGVRSVLVRRDHGFDRHDLNVITVDDTLAALQRLAAWHRSHYRIPVIGITGSNGKTVVKEWLFQLLREEEHVVRSPGSWNSQVGVPLSVWRIDSAHTLGLFEAGISEPGEMERLAPIIAPTLGVFTNIGPAHGEHFPEGDAQKAAEKALLFRHADAVVHCADHPLVTHALAALPCKRIDWSRTGTAYLRIPAEERDASGTTLHCERGAERFTLRVPFTDDASVENAVHCATLLLHLGHAPAWIAQRFLRLEPVAMRLRMVAGRFGSRLIDDSYSNDLASFGIALDQLVRMSGGRERIVVITDIAESGTRPDELYRSMGGALRRADVAQVYAIGPELLAHKALLPGATQCFASVDDLLAHVPVDAITDAVVLVKGARAFGLERVVERWQERTHGTELRIDLEAVRHNLNHYRHMLGPGTRIMAMVKAFGYGSGASELAQLLEHEGVHYLGVAYADEGVDLRQQGLRTPIMVMNPEPVPLDVLRRFQLEPEIYDLTTLRAAIDLARHGSGFPLVHIKLDTGMHRLGFAMDEVPALLDALRQAGALRVGSILSHLAASEDPWHDAFTRTQCDRFREAARRITDVLGYRPLWHIANSAGATRFPEARFDMVRLGIGLHGIGADDRGTASLMPVATLRTVIAQLKEVPAGDTVSYGRTFTATTDMRIAVLPIGYADGLSRRLGHGHGRVWIHGRPAIFTGTICMDMCMVDVTDLACAVGDEAIVFGPAHPLQDYARDLGTIPYEALTSISMRVRRVYTHG